METINSANAMTQFLRDTTASLLRFEASRGRTPYHTTDGRKTTWLLEMRATTEVHSLRRACDSMSCELEELQQKAASTAGYDPRCLLTILTPTSVLPSHPSPLILHRAIDSLGLHAAVVGCRHLVVCDGCPPGENERCGRYATYKQCLRAMIAANVFCTAVELHELPDAVGLPGVILAGCALVRTPFVLIYEHDWELLRPIDTTGILKTLAEHRIVRSVRLNKRRTREAALDFVLKPDLTCRPVALVRTSAWSANPHFAKMSYYRRIILPQIRERPGGGSYGFEEPCFARLRRDIVRLGFDRAHRRWGVFIYGRINDPPVIAHLDGRTTIKLREHAGSIGNREYVSEH